MRAQSLRQDLSSYDGNTFAYDARGMRYRKNQTCYKLNGSQILAETTNGSTITYFLGVDGVIGFRYNNTDYYYAKNLHGDVESIFLTDGRCCAAYLYDAWGNITMQMDIDGSGICDINPIRYRGYYFDRETGFYYTTGRYYDPTTGRFVNPDSQISGAGFDHRGYNLYAYCFNNPVNMCDPSGKWPREITSSVSKISAIISSVTMIVGGPSLPIYVNCKNSIGAHLLYVAQTLHYDKREALNVGLPKDPTEAAEAGWMNSDLLTETNPNGGGPKATFHQFSASDAPGRHNVKWVSPDGKREVIFDYYGNRVTDPRDVGTYNFVPSGTLFGSALHIAFDVIPWIIFGNNDEDPGPVINYAAKGVEYIMKLFE